MSPIRSEPHERTPYIMQRRRTLAIAALALLASAACSSGEGGTGEQAERSGAKVAVANIAYQPDRLEISAGDSVTWTSEDSGVRHTVTSGQPAGETVPGVSEGEEAMPDGTFDGTLHDAGATFTFTFEDKGTFDYFCDVHPSMTGSVVVR